jgi:hypothetical protein
MIAAGSAGLCIVLAAVLRPGADPAPAFITFFGRFHTLALHLPIGVLLLIATAEAMALLPRFRKTIDPVLGLALPFFVVSGFAAFLLGLLLAKSGGYPVKLVALHRTLTLAGILLGAAATFAWTYRHKADGTVRRMPYQAALGLTVLLLTAGAHQGGSMTHGEDFLFRYAPEPMQKLAGFKPKPAATEEEKPAAVAEPLVFDSVVLPILKKKCGECHADGAAKGDLRLHTYAAIMKGGEHGAAVLPRRFTPPKGGPRCARRAEVARLGTGRVMGGYVARGCCSREAALDSLRSGSVRSLTRGPGLGCARWRFVGSEYLGCRGTYVARMQSCLAATYRVSLP